MPPDADDDDPPVVRLVNMTLINAIKKKVGAIRVRVDGSTDYWIDGGWAEEMVPPAKLRPLMIDRIKEMANIDDDAPIRFEGRIRLMLGIGGRKQDFVVTVARSDGGGVAVLELDDVREDTSDDAVMHKASILLQHAEDALAREDARARIREAVLRVEGQPGRARFLRFAARAAMSIGLYDDALEFLSVARTLNADDPRVLVDIETESGRALIETNRVKEGEETLRRSLAIAERFPRTSYYEALPLLLLAKLAIERGDLAQAEAALARVDEITLSLFGPGSAVQFFASAIRVRLMRERGDGAGAETLATSSLRAAEESGLVGEAEELRAELGELALARVDAKAAIEHLREVLELPSRSPMRARVFTTLSRAQRAIGRDADAVSSLRAASALVDGALAADHPLRIEIDRDLATLTATAPYR